jgi:hypothetical protein
MPRKEARIFTSIWQDADFLALAPEAQRMYFLLLSQPELSLCGRLILAESQWSGTAKGMTKPRVRTDLKLLTDADPRPFVLVDYGTDEVLIRSFIRRDRVLLGPKLIKPLVAAVTIVRSPELRRCLRDELQAALGEGTIHPQSLDSVDFMIKILSPQVNTLSDTLSDTPSDRAPDRAKEKESSSLTVRSRKPGRLPPDFQVSPELVAWVRAEYPRVDGRREFAKFVDYWTAASGASSVKKDWDAAFRYWIRNAAERSGQLPLPGATVSPRDEHMHRR